MATEMTIIAPDGTVTTSTLANGSPPSMQEQMPPMLAFTMGLFMGVLALWLIQRWGARKAKLALAGGPTTERAVELLAKENEQQLGQIGRLQDRIAVLERIATDKPTRLFEEIDSLR